MTNRRKKPADGCILQRWFIVLAIFAVPLLESCAVAHHTIRNDIWDTGAKMPTNKAISFYVDIYSGHHTNTYGVRETANADLVALQARYIKTTLATLTRLGYRAHAVDSRDDAYLNINVHRFIQLSALPQEWLTGLSFGLIPSWGTRHGEFEYRFETNINPMVHTYRVDRKSYNHLLLIPVFWVSFFTLNEQKPYQEALVHFVLGLPAPLSTN